MVDHEKHSENSVDKTVERTYERLGKRIRDRFSDKAVARDIVTLGGMTEIYCADHHDPSERAPFESEATKAGVYPTRKSRLYAPAARRICATEKPAVRYADENLAPRARHAPTTATSPKRRRGSAWPWLTQDHVPCFADMPSKRCGT